jgi:hypothetical protein
MTTSHFTTIVLSAYGTYYLVIILADKLKQDKPAQAANDSRQYVDAADFQETPKRATIESETDTIVADEKKNSGEEQIYPVAPDEIQQQAVINDAVYDSRHDLGLETIEVDGIEVNEYNILKLVNSTEQ